MTATIDVPTNKDVLFGRDADSWNHEGNRKFRKVIANYQQKYHSVKLRFDKVAIVAKIVQELKADGVRLLRRRDNIRKKWFEVDHKAYIEKVGHAIRDRRMIQNRKLKKVTRANSITKKKATSKTSKEISRAQSPEIVKTITTHKKRGPILRVHTVSPTNSENMLLSGTEKLSEANAIHDAKAAIIRDPEASATYRDLLKEELLLSSIKKKQAVTQELIKLHEQTAYLKALRANEQNPLLMLPQGQHPDSLNIMLRPHFRPRNLNFVPIPHSSFF